MASRTEDLSWPTAPPRLPSMDEMDYVMHTTVPEPATRLPHPHPPITGAGSCPYSVAHRVDDHGSPLPSPNYNSVSSLLSPARNPAHSPSIHSHQQQHHSHHHSQQQPHHPLHHHSNSLSHSHSHSHSHNPFDPSNSPASAHHWFAPAYYPPAPRAPHWGHQFGALDNRSSSSSLFSQQQLPSLFPIEHHHTLMGGAAGHNSHNHNSSSSNNNNGGGGSGGSGSGLGGPGIGNLFSNSHHNAGQGSLDPFASPTWSLYRQHPHRLPETAQRFYTGPHNSTPPANTNATSAPAISPRSLPIPVTRNMSENQSQLPTRSGQLPEFGSFSHSSSSPSPLSSARASPNPADPTARPPHPQQGPQTPTRREANQDSQVRRDGPSSGVAIPTSPGVSPPALAPLAGGGLNETAAGPTGSSGPTSAGESERRRAAVSQSRATAVEVHVSDDESDSSEDQHMEEMFIQQLGVAGPTFTLRMSDLAEERIRRQQLLRGAMTNKRIASKGALASLQSVELDSLPDNERTCVICYNEFGIPNPEGINEAPLRLPKCKHIFGDHCIKKWFEESDSCPYCRDKVPSEPLMRLNARSVNTIFAAIPESRTLGSSGTTGASAMVPEVNFMYRQAHASPYTTVANARTAWQSARRSPPEDIEGRGSSSRRTRPRHGSLRGASSSGSANGATGRPNSLGGGSSSTPSSQQGSPGRERYFNGPPSMSGPVHWQLHAQMENRRMPSQPVRQQPMATPPIQRGMMPFHMQHRPAQSSGPSTYSASPLTSNSYPSMLSMGQSHMSPGGPDAGYVNPLSNTNGSDSPSSMGPVPPVEAGAPFPGQGSTTPPFSQQLPSVGGLDDSSFGRSGPAAASTVNWTQH